VDFVNIKHNSAGGQPLVTAYIGPSNSNDQAWAMVADTAGNTYLAGNSWDRGTGDDYGSNSSLEFSIAIYLTVKTNNSKT